MCFSATASFTAGVTLSVIGVGTLAKVRGKGEGLLALFPVLFAVQQLIEGLIWLMIDYPGMRSFSAVAIYGYLFFATGLWPVLCPLAVFCLETDLFRRKIILGFVLLGGIQGVYLFGHVLTHGVSAIPFSGSLLYSLKFIPFYEFNKYLYLFVTSLPFLFAHRQRLKLFGVCGMGSFFLAELFYQMTFVSVWCFFAAVLSSGIYFILDDAKLRFLPILDDSSKIT